MLAFDVYLNQKKLCRAGIGDDGVLTTIVNWVTGKDRSDLFLEAGGLVSPRDEHVNWVRQKRLRVGDRIQVKIVEANVVDKPSKRYRIHPTERLNAKKRYVRAMARELGWKIQSRAQ
jgi:hypothetical protein